MRNRFLALVTLILLPALILDAQARDRWSEYQAVGWHQRQPWLVGSNYTPASAINQLEMWQADTFDPGTIDRELAWAESIGMTAMRVFLHNILWETDPQGFKLRVDKFLTIANHHHIRVMFVLFDSCWDNAPKAGPQHPPIPGVHNSGWVQSPGRSYLEDPAKRILLESYVRGIISAFAGDSRVFAWDLWNEPDNPGRPYQTPNDPKLVEPLLRTAFEWARASNPSQPLTSALHWHNHEWTANGLTTIEQIQIHQSDILSFHDYNWPEEFERRARQMLAYGRPVLCTEFLARGIGSTFDGSLPIAKRLDIGIFNWGLVDGKTQTRFPGDSWSHPYIQTEPAVWNHEVFRADGTPYRVYETELIQRLIRIPRADPMMRQTGRASSDSAATPN